MAGGRSEPSARGTSLARSRNSAAARSLAALGMTYDLVRPSDRPTVRPSDRRPPASPRPRSSSVTRPNGSGRSSSTGSRRASSVMVTFIRRLWEVISRLNAGTVRPSGSCHSTPAEDPDLDRVVPGLEVARDLVGGAHLERGRAEIVEERELVERVSGRGPVMGDAVLAVPARIGDDLELRLVHAPALVELAVEPQRVEPAGADV